MKKSLVFLFSVMFLFSILIIAADEVDLSTIDEDAELDTTEGITPDSPLYFVDNFFDNFGDVVKVRQEKVAEIRAMIEAGQYQDALEALEKYKRFAEELEREVSPEQRDEARRSAAAIYNVLKSLESQIPDEFREDFNDVFDHERGIVTAAEIAGKIKALCEELSELDPRQYERVCRTGDDSPKWQQDLDRDLTDEQRVEAEEFFNIMSECFETAGETCRCEDISIEPFADKCSQIAPLAYACDVESDEDACDRMDAIEEEEPIEDLLPDYLKDVLRKLESRFEDDQFDNHAPRECREAGATSREDCMGVMFRLDAPQECIDALDNGDIDLSNEREAREDCERIMFDLNAPRECLDEGLTDFRECGKLMFSLFAPQECIDAGLTGERRSDERDCRELVGGDFHRGPGGPGPGGPGFNCQEIQDSTERLECYDNAANQVNSQHGGFDDENYDGPCMTESDWRAKEEECRALYGDHAGDEPIYGDSGEDWGDCTIDAKCVDFGDYSGGSGGPEGPWVGCEALYCGPESYCEYGECKQYEGYIAPGEGGDEFANCDDCASQCPDREGQRLASTSCGDNGCECNYESSEPQYSEGEGPTIITDTPTEEPVVDEPEVTGAIISGNAFIDYYFR